jgi:hypothetical protein
MQATLKNKAFKKEEKPIVFINQHHKKNKRTPIALKC